MKSNCKSHSGHANVMHSLILSIMLSLSGFLVHSATAGNVYVVSADSDQVWKVTDPGLSKSSTSLGTGFNPLRLAQQPGASRAYICGCASHTVDVLNESTGNVLAQINVSSVVNCPQELAFNSTGTRL